MLTDDEKKSFVETVQRHKAKLHDFLGRLGALQADPTPATEERKAELKREMEEACEEFMRAVRALLPETTGDA